MVMEVFKLYYSPYYVFMMATFVRACLAFTSPQCGQHVFPHSFYGNAVSKPPPPFPGIDWRTQERIAYIFIQLSLSTFLTYLSAPTASLSLHLAC